jgi:hypothetical protein
MREEGDMSGSLLVFPQWCLLGRPCQCDGCGRIEAATSGNYLRRLPEPVRKEYPFQLKKGDDFTFKDANWVIACVAGGVPMALVSARPGEDHFE